MKIIRYILRSSNAISDVNFLNIPFFITYYCNKISVISLLTQLKQVKNMHFGWSDCNKAKLAVLK